MALRACNAENAVHIGDPMRALGLVASSRSLASLRRDALLKSHATPPLSAVVRSRLHPGWRPCLAATA
eukprot:6376345-Heterocapsa_arctica.AAC.1